MRLSHIAASIALSASLTTAGFALAADKDTVDYRKKHMEIIGGHMGSIVAIVKGKVPHADQLRFHADGLAAAAPYVATNFKTEAMSDKTEAKESIWKNWEDFQKRATRLEETSAAFAKAAASGQMSQVGPALGDLGKSCKGCHDEYMEEH